MDHLRNILGGQIGGKIISVHRRDTEYKGHLSCCTEGDPQYEIQSDETDHVAMHTGSALHRID